MTTNTRRLDEHENIVWRAVQNLSRDLALAMDRQLVQDSQLSRPEYAVLITLSESGTGFTRARDIGRQLGWERSRLSHLLKRMEVRGFLHRRTCQTDARGSEIQLTAMGLDAIERAAPGHAALARNAFLDALTREEQDALVAISAKVQEKLRAAGNGAGSPGG